MKVTVTQGIRVVGPDGTVYQNGETADVPERLARHWIHCGWARDDGRAAGTLPDPRGLDGAPKVMPAQGSSDADAQGVESGEAKPDDRPAKPRRRDPRKTTHATRRMKGNNDG